jgi:hypothetical protein
VIACAVTFAVFGPVMFLAWKAEHWQPTARSRFNSIMMIIAVVCILAAVCFAFSL